MTTEQRVTKRSTTGVGPGGSVTLEYEDKNSVELTQDAKGNWRVSGIKVYGQDMDELLLKAQNAAIKAIAMQAQVNALGKPTPEATP